MELNNIQKELRNLIMLLDEWDQSQPLPEIERDLILEKLRLIYEAIRINKSAPVVAQPATEDATTFEEETIAIPVGFGLGDLLISEPLSEESESPFTATPTEPEIEPSPIPEEDFSLNVENIPEVTPAPTPAIEDLPATEEITVSNPIQESAPVPEQNSTISTPTFKEETTPAEPAPQQRPITATLFGEEEIVRHRHKQRVIMSLYDNDSAVQTSKPASSTMAGSTVIKTDFEPADTATEPQTIVPTPNEPLEVKQVSSETVANDPAPTTESSVEPAPAITEISDEEFEIEEISLEEFSSEEVTPEDAIFSDPTEKEHTTESAPPILGEVINPNVQTLADTLTATAPHNIATELRNRPVKDLESAIGINDKFLLIRDLFEGDGVAYTETIRILDTFDDFDECMIHIALNYSWNPNSDGAKLLTELLERKLL